MRLVPSLRVNQLQSSANTNFYIRGFGNGANNAGIEPSVGLFVDGVYRSRSASMIADLPDVQRVEVLKGPQSTLFGKNASAGVISLVTQKPQFELGPDAVGKGGIVRDAAQYAALEVRLRAFADANGLVALDYFDSPITGGDGNREFFLYAAKRPGTHQDE